MSINVVKVLNDGKHTEQSKGVLNFLTLEGYRIPKYIWVGKSNDGIEICEMTKRECIAAIERDNRLFSRTCKNS